MKRVEWANALRGVAAVTVLGYHYAVAFWIHQDVSAGLARRPPLYAGAENAPRWARFLEWLPVNFAALGVGLFFLLSGYVIAISLDRYSRRGFLLGRAMRVLPTYAAGYLVTCATIAFVSDPNQELSLGSILTGAVPGLSLILGSLAPGDGIVWTLIIELVFYAVCVVAYRKLTTRWWAIAGTAVVCAATQWLLDPLPLGTPFGGIRYIVLLACPYIPVMLVGVVLSAYRRGNLERAAMAALIPFLMALYFFLSSTGPVAPTTLEYRLTFVGTIVLFAVIWSFGEGWKRNSAADFFANISYPLYVVHPVLGYALLSVMAAHGVWAPLAVLTATGIAVACAWVVHRLVEVPTRRVGQRWARSVGYESGAPIGRVTAPPTTVG